MEPALARRTEFARHGRHCRRTLAAPTFRDISARPGLSSGPLREWYGWKQQRNASAATAYGSLRTTSRRYHRRQLCLRLSLLMQQCDDISNAQIPTRWSKGDCKVRLFVEIKISLGEICDRPSSLKSGWCLRQFAGAVPEEQVDCPS